MVVELTNAQARALVVRAQLLDGPLSGDVVEVAEQLGSIKIDPTSVIAPAEHTILYGRMGWGYESGQLSKAVELDHTLVEYQGAYRAASLVPALRARMGDEFLHASARAWLTANATFRADILRRLKADGPLPSGAIYDTSQVAASSDSGWYGKTQVPRMLEVMQRAGDIAVAGRDGRTRLWDLAERVYTAAPLAPDEGAAVLAARTLQAHGIAKQRSPYTPVGIAGVEARVEGSGWKFRVDPQTLESLSTPIEPRATILNPYDPVLFDRPRLTELFGFTYVLEQFKPKHERRYGYFAHPILLGTEFVALLDATLDPSLPALKVAALHELTDLSSADRARVEHAVLDLADWLGVPLVGL